MKKDKCQACWMEKNQVTSFGSSPQLHTCEEGIAERKVLHQKVINRVLKEGKDFGKVEKPEEYSLTYFKDQIVAEYESNIYRSFNDWLERGTTLSTQKVVNYTDWANERFRRHRDAEFARDFLIHPKVMKFAIQMDAELKANAHKPGWEEWRHQNEIWSELRHHLLKLENALVKQDKELIREHLADCGNVLMFMGNSEGLYDKNKP